MGIGIGQASKARGVQITTTTSAVATQASGSSFFLYGVWDNTQSFVSISDNKGNVYTQIGSEIAFGTGKARLYYKENGVGGSGHTGSLQISNTAGAEIFLVEVLNGKLAGIIDQSGAREDTSSPFTLASGLTTTQAAEMLLSFMTGNTGVNPGTHTETGLGGSTIVTAAEETDGANFWTGATAYAVKSATGTFNPSWTEASGTDAVVWLVTLNEAAPAFTGKNIKPRMIRRDRGNGYRSFGQIPYGVTLFADNTPQPTGDINIPSSVRAKPMRLLNYRLEPRPVWQPPASVPDSGAAPEAHSGSGTGALGLSASDIAAKGMTTASGVGRLGLSASEAAAKGASTASSAARVGLSGGDVAVKGASTASSTGRVGTSATDTGAKNTTYTSTGRVGLAATDAAKKGLTTATSIGRVGLAGTDAASKGSLATILGRVGLAGSGLGSQIATVLGSAIGRLGLAATAQAIRNALSTASGAVGLRGTSTAIRNALVTSSGRVGLRGSGAFLRNALATALGRVGLAATGAARKQTTFTGSYRLGVAGGALGVQFTGVPGGGWHLRFDSTGRLLYQAPYNRALAVLSENRSLITPILHRALVVIPEHRTLFVEVITMPSSFGRNPVVSFVYADPDSDLDYSITSWLEGLTFSVNPTFIISPVGPTLYSPSRNAAPVVIDGITYAINAVASIWIKAPLVAGTDYTVTVQATFSGGQKDDRSFLLKCRAR